MDPNTALQVIRNLIQTARNEKNPFRAADHHEEVVNRFVELDEWLTRGGFLPTQWDNNQG